VEEIHMPPPANNTFPSAAELVRRTWAELETATLSETVSRNTEQQIIQLPRDPSSGIWVRWPDYRTAESAEDRVEVFLDALKEVLAEHCDPHQDCSLRLRLRATKGESLASCRFQWPAASSAEDRDEDDLGSIFGRPQPSTNALRIDNVEDLLSRRFEIMLAAGERQNVRMARNYQNLFEMAQGIYGEIISGLERRSGRVEAHNLDLYSKRIEEKKAVVAALETHRREDAQVQIQSKALDTATSLGKHVVDGVLSALGLEGGSGGAMLDILKGDPELAAALASPKAQQALKDPGFRGIIKEMFTSLENNVLPPDDPADSPAAFPSAPPAESPIHTQE
jgi:hypothetical protein